MRGGVCLEGVACAGFCRVYPRMAGGQRMGVSGMLQRDVLTGFMVGGYI